MKQNKKGDILVPAVLLLCMLVIFGLALMSMTLSSANLTMKSQSAQQAYYSAKSVTDEVVSLLVSQEAEKKTQHDALLAQALSMTQGQEANADAVTLNGLPGQDAKLTITCTGLDDTQPGVTVYTFRIGAQVTVDTYVRSVSRMVTVTKTMMTEKTSTAGLIVNNAKASVTVQGNVQGDTYIQNAAKVNISGTTGTPVELNGNLYVNTANIDAPGNGSIDISDANINGNAVLVSSGTVQLTNTKLSNVNEVSGNLYVNTSKTDGVYYDVNATKTEIGGETIVLNSATLTFDAVEAQELHINATTAITLQNKTQLNHLTSTLYAAHDGAVSVNDGAWGGSTSPYVAPADDTTEDVFKAENGVTPAQLVSKGSADMVAISNGGNETVDINGNGSNVRNIMLQKFANNSSNHTLTVTGMGTLNIFLDEAETNWNFKNFNIVLPTDGTVNVNIIQTGGGTLQIENAADVNANIILANGGLTMGKKAKISGVVICLGEGDVVVKNDAETSINGTVAWADFSGAFQAGTNLDAYLGAMGQQKEAISFAKGKYGT